MDLLIPTIVEYGWNQNLNSALPGPFTLQRFASGLDSHRGLFFVLSSLKAQLTLTLTWKCCKIMFALNYLKMRNYLQPFLCKMVHHPTFLPECENISARYSLKSGLSVETAHINGHRGHRTWTLWIFGSGAGWKPRCTIQINHVPCSSSRRKSRTSATRLCQKNLRLEYLIFSTDFISCMFRMVIILSTSYRLICGHFVFLIMLWYKCIMKIYLTIHKSSQCELSKNV